MHQLLKKTKKSYCVVLLVLAFLTFFTQFTITTVAAEKGSCGDSLKWKLYGGKLTITGSGAMEEYTEENLPPWYDYRENITVVSLPDKMTSIGQFAFYGCTNLKGVSLPASLTSIGDWSFAKCTNLTYVSMPSGLVSIGESAFQQCESLNGVRIPNGVTAIKDRAFYMCSSLESITIPNSVTEIGIAVFSWCESLVYINFEADVSILPTWSFYNCDNLSSLNLSSSIQSVGEDTFTGCDSLHTVYYPTDDPNGWQWLQSEIEADTPKFVSSGSVNITGSSDHGTSGGTTDKGYQSSKVTENDNASIKVTNTQKNEIDTETNETTSKNYTSISAVVDNEDGWDEVQKLVDDALEQQEKDGNTDAVKVDVQINGSSIGKDELDRFVGKNVDLKVTTSSGSSWVIDMSNTSSGSFKKKYELDYVVSRMEEDDTKIKADSVYQIDFNKSVDLNTQVGVFVGAGNSYQMATLYRKKTIGYEELQTVIVDAEGNVWFDFSGVDAGEKYFVGINAEGVSPEQASVADNAYSEYEYDEESYLMDANGVRYELTGRTSKWGITGKQFAIYVGIAVGLIVIIVTVVMITFNKMSKSKAKYMRRAEESEEEPIDEEAMRLQIMKEMLEEKKKKMMSVKLILFLTIGTIAMLAVMLFLRKSYEIKLWKTVVSAILLTLSGVLGARLMYLLETGQWGGISFFGALFLTPLVMIIVAVILRVPIRTMLDICAPAECIMLALLKVHCKISGCCSGRFLMTRENGDSMFFPSQIVELIAILLVMIALLYLVKKGKYYGKIYLWYMILYGVSRFILNSFRETTPFVLGLPAGHFWSIICVAIGVTIYVVMAKIEDCKRKVNSINEV